MTTPAGTCATCGTDLEPVSLLTALIVTDLDESGTTVRLLFGRACGHAAALLAPSATADFTTKNKGKGPPSQRGTDPRPITVARPQVANDHSAKAGTLLPPSSPQGAS